MNNFHNVLGRKIIKSDEYTHLKSNYIHKNLFHAGSGNLVESSSFSSEFSDCSFQHQYQLSPFEKSIRNFSSEEILDPEDTELRAAVKKAEKSHEFSLLLQIIRTQDHETTGRAVAALRALTRKEGDHENRANLSASGGLQTLLSVLTSVSAPSASPSSPSDSAITENAISVILNISVLEDTRESFFLQKNAPETLIRFLETGSPEARETAAAAIGSLASTNERKLAFQQKGAIPSLLNLLRTGTVRAKKDATKTLYALSAVDAIRVEIATSGGVPLLVELMEEEESVEEKALLVLTSVLKVPEGVSEFLRCDGGMLQLTESLYRNEDWCRKLAAGTLLSLAREHPSTVEEMRKHCIQPVLREMTRSESKTEKGLASKLLALIKGPANVSVDL